jgi:predicted PurR-regulated permease PerM
MPRGLLILLGLAAAVVTIAGLRATADIVGPVFLALVLTVAVQPVRRFSERRGWPRWAGTLLGVAASLGILVGLGVCLALAASQFASLLPQYEDDLRRLLDSGVEWLQSLGLEEAQVDQLVGSVEASELVDFAGGVVDQLVGVMGSLFLVLPLLLFLGVDAASMPEKLDSVRGERGSVVTAFESFAVGTRRYLVVSTVFGFGVAVLDTLFLVFTPIPAPLLWGLLAFITNYIPNVGFVIGVVPPAVLGLLVGGPELFVLVVVVYSLLNITIQSVIQPRFVGEAVGISTSITFLSLVFWAWVLGPLGALFAVPLTLLVKTVLVDVDGDARWIASMLAGRVRPRP